jgi:hypothetical protein
MLSQVLHHKTLKSNDTYLDFQVFLVDKLKYITHQSQRYSELSTFLDVYIKAIIKQTFTPVVCFMLDTANYVTITI